MTVSHVYRVEVVGETILYTPTSNKTCRYGICVVTNIGKIQEGQPLYLDKEGNETLTPGDEDLFNIGKGIPGSYIRYYNQS